MSKITLNQHPDFFKYFISRIVSTNYRMLFHELKLDMEGGRLCVRGSTASYYALQRLLSIVRQIFAARDSRTTCPVHIWIQVGKEQRLFEAHFKQREETRS
ncbi:hypothetical protein Pan161_16440 [Gimesia algae]|uniref:Uncharacterized protein n=1 Tax=Gimesia algae TaxID=2527971 RepID=A0A517VAI3_9PLAN|nr:hypothetical protein Pan161_16440 [Gimesia algae]